MLGICSELRLRGIQTVAVSAVYSPIDFSVQQEETVQAILQREIPGVSVTISKDVANLGKSMTMHCPKWPGPYNHT